MDYTPVQQWVTQNVLKTPTVFQRASTKLTDYDAVHTGNVVPGEIDITDPGQIGRSNLPSLHTDVNVRDDHTAQTMPVTDTLTSLIPRAARWVGLRGTRYDPFTFTDIDDNVYEYTAQPGVGQQPFGPIGVGGREGDPYEHGPITVDELEEGKNIRQARRLRQRQFVRSLLFLKQRNLDSTGSRDERVIAGTGREEKDEDRLSDAALGVGHTFVIPDVRRTFDQPKDAPPGTPVDATGAPIYDKAGFPLTPTALEGSPHEITTSHAYPSFTAISELPVGDTTERVRAGVQYDVQSTRPAVMPHWYDFRPFDQFMAHGNLALKGQVRPPSASRPVMTNADDQTDVWSAGRHYRMPAAGMTALSIMPNIDRQAPQAWDSNAYLTPSPTSIDPRAAAWRLS